MIQDPSDHELLQRMQRGDEESFVALYRRRQGEIYRFALRMSGSESIAEDVTQEVFMTLMKLGDQYDPAIGSLSSYLFGIARNKVLRRLERDRCYIPISRESAQYEAAPTLPADPLGDLTRAETIEGVRQAVLSLPLRYREVVVLCDLQEISYSEAAGMIGCPEGTVRSRLYRARGLLIEKLREAHAAGTAPAVSQPRRCLA